MNRKLTDQDVIDIRSSTLTNRELSATYGLHRDNILSCRKGKTYKHVPNKFVPYILRRDTLTADQVIKARSGLKAVRILSKEFGISKTNINHAINGKHHKKVGGYANTENFKPRKLTRKKIMMIKYYLGRGYLNYGQLEKHFKVSRQTVFKLNEYGKRPEGKRPKFNGISYAYIKALFQIYENYREVAEAINEKPNTIYGLLTKERLSINYVR